MLFRRVGRVFEAHQFGERWASKTRLRNKSSGRHLSAETTMSRTLPVLVLALAVAVPSREFGQESKQEPPRLTADALRGLQLRTIGPTLTSGRIADVAVDPRNRSVWYVATA